MDGDEAELPIFDVQRVQLRFDISAEFVAAQVANNVLILGLASGRLLRFDLDNAEDIDDIDLPKKPSEIGTIRKLFLDPSASHLLISTSLGENFYLHSQSRQPKALSRLKGVQIDSVAWNPALPTASTREILLGSSDGNIYETYIESTTEFYRREEKYVRNAYHVNDGAIAGIWSDIQSDLRRVIVATPTRLLQFETERKGAKDNSTIYPRLFETQPQSIHENKEEVRDVKSALTLSPTSDNGHLSSTQGRNYAWLSNDAVVYGQLTGSESGLTTARKNLGEAKTITRTKLFSSPTNGVKANLATDKIRDIIMTQFHVLALAGERLVAMNRLDESIVYDQRVLESDQIALALYADQQKNTYWLLTRKDIYELVVTDESRHIWKTMLAEHKFDLALSYATTPAQKNTVSIASGDYFMEKGQLMEAAGTYGRSDKPFEEVALALIDRGDNDAIRRYLIVKLSQTKKNLIMQRVMMASWLVELFMVKLNSIDDQLAATTMTATSPSANQPDEMASIRREFQDFVTKYKADLDKKTIYEILSSHGREGELLFFATSIQDYSYVLQYWIQRSRWDESMKVLQKQTDAETFYQYSSLLIVHVPVELVDVLMRQSNLDPVRLIPALLTYNRETKVLLDQNQAVRYLLFCINQEQSTDTIVHNTLISIYASYPGNDEGPLLSYLQTQTATDQQQYDIDFALRLCITHKRIQSAVHLYCTMSQYASAVDLALRHNENDLAISVADRPDNNLPLRRKLWLQIAKKIMSESKGVSAAMDLLKKRDFLRIEDLIPLFPDFVVIDDFKEEICQALEDYSRQIDNLRSEMDKSALTSKNIKDDIKALEERYAIVEPGERCWICRLPLLMRQFFVFPCQHAFHAECLGKFVIEMAPEGRARRIADLQEEIGRGVVNARRKERLIRELDGLVAGACVLCGDMAVKQIDQPFVTSAEERELWRI